MSDLPEASGIVGLVFHGVEVRLGEGVVVGHPLAAVAALDAEAAGQLSEAMARHRCAAVLVHNEGSRVNAVARDSLAEELVAGDSRLNRLHRFRTRPPGAGRLGWA